MAHDLHPERHPLAIGQMYYWKAYGQALAHVRGRHDEAVMALRRAERLFPTKMARDPVVREVLSGLVARSRRDAVGRELRAMAYRAGVTL